RPLAAACVASGHAAAPPSQRDELAPFHCPMSPVLPTGRIAHLGSADCCIHPPGRNETIGVTPPIIFSKGGSQSRKGRKEGHILPDFRSQRTKANVVLAERISSIEGSSFLAACVIAFPLTAAEVVSPAATSAESARCAEAGEL